MLLLNVGVHHVVISWCRNLNLGLATKARACKVVAQEEA